MSDDEDVVVVPITEELDLHTFAPRDVKELVADYIVECVERGFVEVRIVHGKGTGTLRRIVHSVLDKHELVVEYQLAHESRGGWGATIACLQKSTAS